MVQKNGYFTVEIISEEEALCRVYPSIEGAPLVSYREITSYLDSHGFNYDTKLVNRCIFSSEPQQFPLRLSSATEYADDMTVEVSSDKMSATCRFYSGSKNGSKLTVRDIMAGLQSKGVVFGIDQSMVMDFIENPVYCTDLEFAKGTIIEEGKDAWVEYLFNTDISSKPAYNEDGSVDFHNLDIISQVSAGQKIAVVHKEIKGKNGRDVSGKEKAARQVKPILLQGGKNIRLSEDRQEAFSEVTGHAKLINGQIFVSDVYEVPADVDNSTGDINYSGNVAVKGCVREGFQINARGNVIIEGSVEGAMIISGGQIIIKGGVNGMNRGVLQATGNIVTKFIENTKVFSGGYVDTGSIIHSSVTAKSDVVVKDKKGFITGSVIRSGGKVEANTIGSQMGAATTIEIGGDPQAKQKCADVENHIRILTEEINKIKPIVLSYASQLESGVSLDPKNKEYYIKLVEILNNNSKLLAEKSKDFEVLKKELEKSKDSKVVVTRDIYPGVTVVCSNISYTFKEKRSYCYIEKKDGEIVIQNL